MNRPDSLATAGRNYSIRVFSLSFERVTSEKRLYEKTQFAEDLQLGFDTSHILPFVSEYCAIFVLSTFLTLLFCPCGTKCSIKLTTVE